MPFQCDECNSTFNERKSLNRHIRSKHQISEEFKCEHCEYKSNRKDNLARHLVKHSESRKRKLDSEPHVTPKKRKIEPEPHVTRKKIYEDDEVFLF